MKTCLLIVALALVALNAHKAHAAPAGRFAISSSTFTPGGDLLKGGRFSLRTAVGQHDAGSIRGGRFALDGGFIPAITIEQAPGAPKLKIRLNRQGDAVLSWPIDAQGWLLEETAAINYQKWNAVPTTVIDTDTEHTVTVPATGVMKCYRLKQP